MTIFGRAAVLTIGLWAFAGAGAAVAQENLDAGKTGAQLYAADCTICHKSPDGLAKAGVLGLESFLREHYTASRESAAMIADYLKSADKGQEPARVRTTKRTKGDAKDKREKSTGGKASSVTAAEPGMKSTEKTETKSKSDMSKSDMSKSDEPKSDKADKSKSEKSGAEKPDENKQ